MITYVWKARTRDGQIKSGEIKAVNENEASVKVRSMDLIPLSLKEKPKSFFSGEISFGKPKISMRDIALFTRQFSTMLSAGLNMMEGLKIQRKQVTNKGMKNLLTDIIGDMEGGSQLGEAMANHKDVFGDLYVNMVKAGEKGGALDSTLPRLAAYLEKDMALRAKIKGAMIYPLVIGIVLVVAIAVLMIFVVPIFEQLFKGFGAELPMMTKSVLMFSKFIQNFWWLIIIIVVGILQGIRFVKKTKPGLYFFDRMALKYPVFGDLMLKQAIARFTRTLATLQSSGVPIIDALTVTANTSGNKILEDAILAARDSIKEGESISEPLEASKLFPPMVTQMIRIGEKTGQLDDMLNRVADFYDEEVDTAVTNLTTALEPIIMVVMGITVGYIVIAMYMPQFQLIQHIM